MILLPGRVWWHYTAPCKVVRGKARWALPTEEARSEIGSEGSALRKAEHAQVLRKSAEVHEAQQLTWLAAVKVAEE